MNTKIDEVVSIHTKFGLAEIISFKNLSDNKEHIALAFGDWRNILIPKIRIHSECLTGDVFESERCDCGPQLQEAMQLFAKTSGIILYMRQEGRGIGLLNKLRAYRLQDQGYDTYEANRLLGFDNDERSFGPAVQMLNAMGIQKVRLLSNNPKKAKHLEDGGIAVVQRMFTKTHVCAHNEKYLKTKSEHGGHDGLEFFKQGVEK